MKVKTKDNEGFKPFTLEVTFETLDEAREIYHRLNASVNGMKRTNLDEEYHRYPGEMGLMDALFEEVDYHIKGLD